MLSEQIKSSEANLNSQKVEGSWERTEKLNMMSINLFQRPLREMEKTNLLSDQNIGYLRKPKCYSTTEVLNTTLLSLQVIKGNYLTNGRLLIHKIMYMVSVHISVILRNLSNSLWSLIFLRFFFFFKVHHRKYFYVCLHISVSLADHLAKEKFVFHIRANKRYVSMKNETINFMRQ